MNSPFKGHKAEGVDGNEAGGDRQQDGGVLQVTSLLELLSHNRDPAMLTYSDEAADSSEIK